METLEGYRQRVDDETSSLPVAPTKPYNRPPAKADKAQLHVWHLNQKQWAAYRHWDQFVIKALQLIFPNRLTDKEKGHTGMLPMHLTGRTAMYHIESKTKTDTIATKAYCDLIDEMIRKKYVPNSNGQVQYFKELRMDHTRQTHWTIILLLPVHSSYITTSCTIFLSHIEARGSSALWLCVRVSKLFCVSTLATRLKCVSWCFFSIND